jgi:putative transposase
VRGPGIEEAVTAPLSPWQSPNVKRLIASIRQELLDHILVLDERELHRLWEPYFAYDHEARPHRSPEWNAPVPREIEAPEKGRVSTIPEVGGLHHRYRRCA